MDGTEPEQIDSNINKWRVSPNLSIYYTTWLLFYGTIPNQLRFLWDMKTTEVWKNDDLRTNKTSIKGWKLSRLNMF